ncbi:MAG: RHS repeat-associated core domain-containing protein, partial [Acidobacteriota bacterium]|nr:RHS repeat-associated core domain-containing protein [Acidobacteriota bacterium]
VVTDHLGTPRMVIDQTGSLAGVSRHDYLPFGEELRAGAAGRTAGRGYKADAVRHKFTGYERDPETGLDFAQARYYASVQGRFTSVDPLPASARLGRPQSWNRYSYCLSNPLVYVDPSGLIWGRRLDENGNQTGEPIWYKDEDAMGAAGATAFTPEHWTYETGDGRWVLLNPKGPGSQPESYATLGEYLNGGRQFDIDGWMYVRAPDAPPDLAPGIEMKPDHIFFFTGAGQSLFGLAGATASSAASRVFSTEPGQAVFHTGGVFARESAEAFALANGGKTLTMTPGGRALSSLDSIMPEWLAGRISDPFWGASSRMFARGASGPVNVFRGEATGAGSQWLRNEVPNLLRNPNVQTGVVHKVP